MSSKIIKFIIGLGTELLLLIVCLIFMTQILKIRLITNYKIILTIL